MGKSHRMPKGFDKNKWSDRKKDWRNNGDQKCPERGCEWCADGKQHRDRKGPRLEDFLNGD